MSTHSVTSKLLLSTLTFSPTPISSRGVTIHPTASTRTSTLLRSPSELLATFSSSALCHPSNSIAPSLQSTSLLISLPPHCHRTNLISIISCYLGISYRGTPSSVPIPPQAAEWCFRNINAVTWPCNDFLPHLD